MNRAERDVVLSPSDSLVWDPASSIPTLIGSLLSLAATSTVILLWIFAGGRKRDFRYALILNLTVAEFLNALNNSVSGIAANVLKKPLSPGAACNFNGWAGQFSVQAVDFSILAISIITLLTIQLRSFIIYASTTTKTLICLSIWIIPSYTSIHAWRKEYYGPVSGNWCWITAHHPRQRYTLSHAWRFAILIITFCTYIFVFVYMSRRLKPQELSRSAIIDIDEDDDDDEEFADLGRAPHRRDNAVLSGCSTPAISIHARHPSASHEPHAHRRNNSSVRLSARLSTHLNLSSRTLDRPSPSGFQPLPSCPSPTSPTLDFEKSCPPPDVEKQPLAHIHSEPASPITTTTTARQQTTRTTATASPPKSSLDREIWRMTLLNMYPVTYFILWIPGIANRVAEAMGVSSRVLVVMQCSTQFVGVANAGVYVWREHWGGGRGWRRVRTGG
ncbi:hypothetical protein P153DRAFT_429035 [Dothidotthia symphoricarpi CBS 119687]|uniref:Glucose receptor Git3-like N-terminal domain-containing protein n=1 Tax=Dothidotthia symphoricarpi CBS 119687 TaxID=1392245 RepID=A0A6A6AQB2_9PLEO|nr:uncharacterized protein P153DRAFT_429035 [Dothidotthia symphoricarpi CBS 119687]KAF2133037.1 hypothetical protein P153DRAFT_429035 [Dothidotthia symphoricarpi CBS 119687]